MEQVKVNKLNFGCGADIKKGWDNVDMQEGKGIIKSFDFDNFPYPLKKDHYDYVLLAQVIEHLMYPEKTLEELYRCCKNGAIIRIETPHYSNKGAYNSLQHRGFFNERAFTNFVQAKTLVSKKENIRIKSLIVTPTNVGRFVPRFIRDKLSLFINGLHSQIHVEYEVVK